MSDREESPGREFPSSPARNNAVFAHFANMELTPEQRPDEIRKRLDVIANDLKTTRMVVDGLQTNMDRLMAMVRDVAADIKTMKIGMPGSQAKPGPSTFSGGLTTARPGSNPKGIATPGCPE